MNNLLKSILIVLIGFVGSTAAAESQGGCAIKEVKIQKQLEYAKATNRDYQVLRLEKALSEVRAHCNDAELKAKLEKKIQEKKNKVAEREADFKKAQDKGDAKKIIKRERKVLEAREELVEAEEELASYFK